MRDGSLSPEVADALEAACAATGMDRRCARLLRVHSNTVIYLPGSQAIARIAAGRHAGEHVAASLTATQWLSAQGLPTVRPKVDRHFKYEGLVVSFWEYEELTHADRSSHLLAHLLRELHAFQDVTLALPAMMSPLDGVRQSMCDHPEAFDGSNREWLASEIDECERRWALMRFALPLGLIHGDAHPNNLLHTARGPILCDWDHVAYGPREWDLVQGLYFSRRFPAMGDDPDTAADAYGWDLRDWSGADDLVAVREISGLGAYVRTAAAKPLGRRELNYRINTLRRRDLSARWNPPSRA